MKTAYNGIWEKIYKDWEQEVFHFPAKPPANFFLCNDDKNWYYTYLVPGSTKEDVLLEINSGILNLKIVSPKGYFNTIDAKLILPSNFGKITAKVENGVLVITVEKLQPPVQKIEVL